MKTTRCSIDKAERELSAEEDEARVLICEAHYSHQKTADISHVWRACACFSNIDRNEQRGSRMLTASSGALQA